MKTIERYVFGSFLSSFVLAFFVLSFVLTIGILVQIVSFIMDGIAVSLVGEFCLVSLPETLQWSVPLALLVSSVLVFSRMSADSEIAAMRACGIHLFQVMKYPLFVGLFCTFLGFWVNNEIVPRGHRIRRTLKARVSVGMGLSLLEPGHTIDDFPKVKLYFGAKEGNWLYDLVALDYSDPDVSRTITADKALVTQDGADIKLDLYQMTVNPLDAKHPSAARFGRFVYTIKDALREKKYSPTPKDMRFREIVREIARLRAAKDSDLTEVLVEFMKRFVYAMASFCFILIGIPLGIRSQRKDSSIGMAISLAVSLGYYVIMLLMLSFEKCAAIHPECLIWIPVVICFLLAIRLTRKHL